MLYYLPKTVEINGKELNIRYDFRVILDIMAMLNDPDLDKADKAQAAIEMFYCDSEAALATPQVALENLFWFIDQGNETKDTKKSPRLIDWEQDFNLIIAPVNRVLGYESRAVDYDMEKNIGGLHWWTFLAAYMEIGGDCTFSQVVSIRDKQARGKKLEKWEREWLRHNRDIIVLKTRYSTEDDEILKQFIGGAANG